MNSWENWANFVLKDLERITEMQNKIVEDLTEVKMEITALKTSKESFHFDNTMFKLRTGMLGLGAGSVPSILSAILDLMK